MINIQNKVCYLDWVFAQQPNNHKQINLVISGSSVPLPLIFQGKNTQPLAGNLFLTFTLLYCHVKKMLLASHQHSHLPTDVQEGTMAANSSLHQFMIYFCDRTVIAKTRHKTVVLLCIIGSFSSNWHMPQPNGEQFNYKKRWYQNEQGRIGMLQ